MEILFNTKEDAFHAFEGIGSEQGYGDYFDKNFVYCRQCQEGKALWDFAFDGKPMCLHLVTVDGDGKAVEVSAKWYAASQDDGARP